MGLQGPLVRGLASATCAPRSTTATAKQPGKVSTPPSNPLTGRGSMAVEETSVVVDYMDQL